MCWIYLDGIIKIVLIDYFFKRLMNDLRYAVKKIRTLHAVASQIFFRSLNTRSLIHKKTNDLDIVLQLFSHH